MTQQTKIVGIFGGTFDPIHQGHLKSLALLGEHIAFDKVHWVLSARPPHKETVSSAIKDRFAMLELALQTEPNYIADDREVQRDKPSYTYETLMTFKQQYVNDSLYLILGADNLTNLHSWYRYQDLLSFANMVFISRPGYSTDLPDYLRDKHVALQDLNQHNSGKIAVFEDASYPISATEIREQISAHNSLEIVAKKLPELVSQYIQQHQLYQLNTMNDKTNMPSPEQIKDQVLSAVDDMKGQDAQVIDIQGISNFADYMIVVSGTSDTHVKAVAREASNQLRKNGIKPLNEDGADLGEWVLVDFGDVVLHVMRPEVRDYYELEKLWDEDVRAMVQKHRQEQES